MLQKRDVKTDLCQVERRRTKVVDGVFVSVLDVRYLQIKEIPSDKMVLGVPARIAGHISNEQKAAWDRVTQVCQGFPASCSQSPPRL